ncbi:hypothetical protein ACFXKX_38060 [Streptomyces scopuliridis]|uniref:hypothetical protein n=1 Tax=Streptomyces scopuliridis TaxID=452529 RepID=UPI0036755EAD
MPLGAAELAEPTYAPLVSERTSQLIRRSDPELYQLAVVVAGVSAATGQPTLSRGSSGT